MDIGTHLRAGRERRGMTLRQLADATKLSATTLGYIERSELGRLPGGIFAKGYLRACAAEVAWILRRLCESISLSLPPWPPTSRRRSPPGGWRRFVRAGVC